MTIDWQDPAHQEIRDAIRQYAEAHFDEAMLQSWDREERLPEAALAHFAGLGYMGFTVPREYGGGGRDIGKTLVVIEELSRISLSLAVPYLMTACYAGVNMTECGSEAQKRRFLPRVAQGAVRFAFALTERAVGSDLAMVATTAQRRGDRIVVSGEKHLINGVNIADHLYALVRTDAPEHKYRNLSLLLIPVDAPGVSTARVQSLGMRGGAQLCTVRLDDVELDTEAIVGGEAGWNHGWKLLVGPGLDIEKLEVAAMALGVAQAAVDEASAYACERIQFGAPIAGLPGIRHFLADARTNLLACTLMLRHAAERIQAGLPCATESAMAKLFICEQARDIVLGCQTTMGAYGCIEGHGMQRRVRDALIFPLVGGSSAIQRNNLAKRLGLPQ